MKRRDFFSLAAGGLIGSSLASTASAQTSGVARRYQKGASPWPVCLDTATIRPASLEDKVKFAAEAGYDAIEPWDGELDEYERKGG
ncbi:MAG: sugar phosphate isomerase/epimerase, partial [Verrucomicrobiae bacterium]|nr:sugar phosphate isomerase/epimerase [Verrucomicrobiae bacterium]